MNTNRTTRNAVDVSCQGTGNSAAFSPVVY